MKLNYIDDGNEFDFGKVSGEYSKYRDIYPKSMYKKLISFGIGKHGQQILDLDSGTAVLPINLYHTGTNFTATDISENQITYGQKLAEQKGMEIQRTYEVKLLLPLSFEEIVLLQCNFSSCFPNRFNLKHSLKNVPNCLKYYNFYFKIMLVGLFQ